ncbi:hypothetical protein MB02_05170 [Croceicoccus estronivorus]|uniref:hypothetical protein n=1 Tax=Croceicoccus estronivorus TaxID=1172626 RepID=UPI000829A432|nr:hypothetical protein [Croceicoccus estronivorus]OCC24853.1 hypothetical protein MB02_05170 [Croceicoccus estronivorus]
MTTRRHILALLVSGAAMLLAGCNELFPETYRYRLTVEVDTPEGPRAGSSVIEVSGHKGIGIPGPEAGGWISRVQGEAVAVDLPNGRTLFALLRSEDGRGAESYAWALLPQPLASSGTSEKHDALRAVVGAADLERENYPMLVTFRNITVPASVEAVDPGNLGASFGPGYALHRITVQITDDHLPDRTGHVHERRDRPASNR